jgi:hypothetical protein
VVSEEVEVETLEVSNLFGGSVERNVEPLRSVKSAKRAARAGCRRKAFHDVPPTFTTQTPDVGDEVERSARLSVDRREPGEDLAGESNVRKEGW